MTCAGCDASTRRAKGPRDSPQPASPRSSRVAGSHGRPSQRGVVAVWPSVRQLVLSDASATAHAIGDRGRELSVRAAGLLAPIVANSALSVAVAWLATLCFSRGNIFSNAAPAQQSHRTFLIATLVWVHVFFCGTVWLARSVSLFHLHLVPERRAGAARMLLKMLRRTGAWFVLSACAVAAVGYACGSLSDNLRQYRPEIYASSVFYYSFMPVADRAARRIYRSETVEGRAKQHRSEQPTGPTNTQARVRRRRRRWLSVLCHGSVVLAAFLVPFVYVHSISLMGVQAATRFAAALTVASLALKIAMQEAAKLYIVRTEIRNARAMALLVALPTVLIDTQVRIVLLRFQSVQLAVSTTLALALGEIATRVAKAKWLQWKIGRRALTVSRRTSANPSIAPAPLPHEQTVHQQNEELAVWRVQLRNYHTIELSADMYAEYLAIGCSSAITVIFGDHPQFLLRSDSLPSPPGIAGSRVAAALLGQVAVEVLVDLCACAVELSSGLAAPEVHERAFFLALFAGLAIVNVNTSAILYLAY